MTTRRMSEVLLACGVLCFLVGGAAVGLRMLGTDVIAADQTTLLVVAGLMLVAVGASIRRAAR